MMGDPAYEARRAAERAERQARERRDDDRAKRDALAEEVAQMFLEAAKGFFQGHGCLVVERIDDGRSIIRYQA